MDYESFYNFSKKMPNLKEISKFPGCENILDILNKYSFTEEELTDRITNKAKYFVINTSLNFDQKIIEECRWLASSILNVGKQFEPITELHYPLEFISELIILGDNVSVIRALTGTLNKKHKLNIKCPLCNLFVSGTLKDLVWFSNGNLILQCGKCAIQKDWNIYDFGKQTIGSLFRSLFEEDIFESIKSLYNGIYRINDRCALKNKQEIDIYLPNLHIGIECNGDYWHKSKTQITPSKIPLKSIDYHYKKFIDGLNNNILIVNIFETEWKRNKNKITEYLKDLFNNKKNKLSFFNKNCLNLNYPLPLELLKQNVTHYDKIEPYCFNSILCDGVLYGTGKYNMQTC